ncbi:hypothetical protein RTCIAT899_PC04620 (plasmid) [Rhizobium tropici CIAT 899]|nr:hypothetical protein RTCIAT899_PC04620 [Rhizobium tropici CIAT 899]
MFNTSIMAGFVKSRRRCDANQTMHIYALRRRVASIYPTLHEDSCVILATGLDHSIHCTYIVCIQLTN